MYKVEFCHFLKRRLYIADLETEFRRNVFLFILALRGPVSHRVCGEMAQFSNTELESATLVNIIRFRIRIIWIIPTKSHLGIYLQNLMRDPY